MPRLKDILDRFYAEFDVSFLKTDPVLFLHRYPYKADKEVIGFISALFAYGSVALIVRNLEGIFEKLGEHPAEFIKNTDIHNWVQGNFTDWKYRFHKPDDLEALLLVVQATLREYGSLNNAFLASTNVTQSGVEERQTVCINSPLIKGVPEGRGLSVTRTGETLSKSSRIDLAEVSQQSFKIPLNNFVEALWANVPERTRGMKFFLPSPKGKGTCKRLNLFLRWMVRKDSIDCGIWEGISPAELYFPVDTHIHQIASDLKITKLKNPTWKTVEEITNYFKKLDPNDPVKYDFALTRLGMLKECPLKGEATTCTGCPLKPYCSKRNIVCQ